MGVTAEGGVHDVWLGGVEVDLEGGLGVRRTDGWDRIG